jgi:hypothetical protein
MLVQMVHGNFLFLDDQGYDRVGWLLAQEWHASIYPPPASVAITASWFYYVFVAAVYYVAGHHWLVVKLAGALLSALSVPCAAAVGTSLGGRRLGIRAAWLAALYPAAVFWGSAGIKDGPMATLLLAVAAIALRPLTMRRLAGAVALLVVAFLSRPVVGVVGAAMLLVPAACLISSGLPRPEELFDDVPRLLVLAAGIPAAVVMLALEAARYLPELTGSLAGTQTFRLSTGPTAVNYVPSPADVAHALLSPVRWFGPATDAAYIPGVFVWTVLLPVTALGCWDLLRRGPAAARGVVLSALGFLYLYTCVFQGPGFTRQRYTVEILLLVAALHAFARFPDRAFTWTAMSACAVALVQLAQALDVPRNVLEVGVLTVSAAGAAACLAHLLRQRHRERSRPRRRAPGRHAHSASSAITSSG